MESLELRIEVKHVILSADFLTTDGVTPLANVLEILLDDYNLSLEIKNQILERFETLCVNGVWLGECEPENKDYQHGALTISFNVLDL